MKETYILPRAPVARILVNVGAKRVSQSATEVFAESLEKIAEEIASRAVEISKHSGRKTVQDSDIKLAAK